MSVLRGRKRALSFEVQNLLIIIFSRGPFTTVAVDHVPPEPAHCSPRGASRGGEPNCHGSSSTQHLALKHLQCIIWSKTWSICEESAAEIEGVNVGDAGALQPLNSYSYSVVLRTRKAARWFVFTAEFLWCLVKIILKFLFQRKIFCSFRSWHPLLSHMNPSDPCCNRLGTTE